MQMFRAKCGKCGWTHDVVTFPMLATAATAVMKSSGCPMCGNRKGNLVAAPRTLTDEEAAHKAQVMAAAQPALRTVP